MIPAAALLVLAAVAAVRAARSGPPPRRLGGRRPPARWTAPVVVLVGAVVVGAGPLIAVLAAAGAAAVPALRQRQAATRARREADDALPDVVDLVARSARSGSSLPAALAAAAEGAPPALAAELGAMAVAVDRGRPLAAAVDDWAACSTVEGAGLVAAAVVLLGDAGGDAALALESVASTLRDRRAARREVAALATQATSSATVLAVAPAGFAVLAAAIDPTTARFLVTSPIGVACLTTGVALDLLGWRWMHRITTAAGSGHSRKPPHGTALATPAPPHLRTSPMTMPDTAAPPRRSTGDRP